MKRLIVKPIREEDKEHIERMKKLYEEKFRQLYEKAVRQNREDIYMEVREGSEFKSNKK